MKKLDSTGLYQFLAYWKNFKFYENTLGFEDRGINEFTNQRTNLGVKVLSCHDWKQSILYHKIATM